MRIAPVCDVPKLWSVNHTNENRECTRMGAACETQVNELSQLRWFEFC